MTGSRARGITLVEAVAVISVTAVALAATAPACVRAVRWSRTAEATDNLSKIVEGAIQARTSASAAPLPAPLTPSSVPRGEPVSDPAGAWEHPTWKAIGFSLETAHWYSYRVEFDPDPATPVRAVAHGDLDGDGVLSTFTRTATRTPSGVVAAPGVVISDDLE